MFFINFLVQNVLQISALGFLTISQQNRQFKIVMVDRGFQGGGVNPRGCALNYYYHPETKFVKVMFSQVSVCPLSRRGGLRLCPGGLCPGGLCPGGSLSRGTLSRGISVRDHPPYGNEQVVRILLECILFSGGSRIFPRGVRQLPKLQLFFRFLPKTA